MTPERLRSVIAAPEEMAVSRDELCEAIVAMRDKGIPDAWLVIGAEAHLVFDDKLKADRAAGKWGRVLPLYRGPAIPEHVFTGNGPGVVGADNCQVCGLWHDEHPRIRGASDGK